MKTQQQNIAIAKVCGWTDPVPPTRTGWMRPPNSELLKSPPDYISDLNACFEMEKVLDANRQLDYARRLHELFNGSRHYLHIDFDVAHATAPQRCEAFLKCLGLWQDDPAKSS